MTECWGSDNLDDAISIKTVNKSVGLDDSGELATIGEIDMARELLKQVLCGLANSFFEQDHSHLPLHSLSVLTGLRGQFSNVKSEQQICVPTASGRDIVRVMKVTFGYGDGQHSPPDPLLLAVKAANVWSTRNKQPLMASGGVDADDDQDNSEY